MPRNDVSKVDQAAAIKNLIDSKMQEALAYAVLDYGSKSDEVRSEVHAFVDMYMDLVPAVVREMSEASSK